MFKKATRSGSRLRAMLYGPSGSGKTFTALRLARGLGGKIAVIDSERGRASKYAGVSGFEFDVCELTRHTIEDYRRAMGEAAGYDVLIIDSLSHAWQALLEEVDRKASASRSGNKFNVWADATPKQRAFMDAILAHPSHVICTCRAVTEWAQEKDERGKNKPVKLGLKPEQGKGIEYEFDVLAALDPDHFMKVEKDNSQLFQDQVLERPGEEVGKAWADWLAQAVDTPVKTDPPATEPPEPTTPPGKKINTRQAFLDGLAAALESRPGIDQAETMKAALDDLLVRANKTPENVTPKTGNNLIAAVRDGKYDKFPTPPENTDV